MDKELAFTILFVFSAVVYFPVVEALPTRVECTIALGTAVALYLSNKVTETKVLLQIANLYHLYLLVVSAILQTIPMDYIVTITQMILSVAYAYNRVGMLELVQLVILCFYPLVTTDNTFRMALAVVVYGSETHFGKEHAVEYLSMVLLPILRLPIIMARLYTAFVLACRAYVVYLKRNEIVKVEEPPPEEEEERRLAKIDLENKTEALGLILEKLSFDTITKLGKFLTNRKGAFKEIEDMAHAVAYSYFNEVNPELKKAVDIELEILNKTTIPTDPADETLKVFTVLTTEPDPSVEQEKLLEDNINIITNYPDFKSRIIFYTRLNIINQTIIIKHILIF